MSKTLMWSLSDSREINARCLFNEDARAYEVLVSTPLCARDCREESFPAPVDPVWAMSAADYDHSMALADRMIAEVAQELGDH